MTQIALGSRASNRARGLAKKSELRSWIVDEVLATLCEDHIFRTLDYRRKNEAYLKQYMHQPLQRCMARIVERERPGLKERTRQVKAQAALLWEGDVTTTVNHVRFLGVQHRPDFVVRAGGTRIAVEVKRGESGAAIREGIGQALAYTGSGEFGFVVYLFVDTSKDKKIVEAVAAPAARAFVHSLWQNYNVRFAVI